MEAPDKKKPLNGDLLPDLWEQRRRLLETAIRRQRDAETTFSPLPDMATEDACQQLDAIEWQIARAEATTLTGLAIQFELLAFLIGEEEHVEDGLVRAVIHQMRSAFAGQAGRFT